MQNFGPRKRRAGVALVIALCVGLTACGESDKAEPAAAAADSSGKQAAAAYLAKFTKGPTSVGDLEPLASKPPTGKSLIYLLPPTPVAKRSGDGLEAAAQALGWTYGTVDAGATPADAVSAFSAAIARKPDLIVFGGLSADTLTQQIQQAKKAGIIVGTIGSASGPTDGVLANLGGAEQEAVYGKLVAAYFVVNGGPKAEAAVVTLPAFPIFTSFVDSFRSAVKEWCSECKTKVLDQQPSDLGTKTPANIAAFLQRNPSTKWLVGTTGDLTQGARAAIDTAGLSGVNIIGEVPNAANLANLEAGKETAWAGYAVDILSWRLVDVFARHFAKEDIADAVAVPLPVQMLTKENVKEAKVDAGYYVGVGDYAEQFKTLWQVK